MTGCDRLMTVEGMKKCSPRRLAIALAVQCAGTQV